MEWKVTWQSKAPFARPVATNKWSFEWTGPSRSAATNSNSLDLSPSTKYDAFIFSLRVSCLLSFIRRADLRAACDKCIAPNRNKLSRRGPSVAWCVQPVPMSCRCYKEPNARHGGRPVSRQNDLSLSRCYALGCTRMLHLPEVMHTESLMTRRWMLLTCIMSQWNLWMSDNDFLSVRWHLRGFL